MCPCVRCIAQSVLQTLRDRSGSVPNIEEQVRICPQYWGIGQDLSPILRDRSGPVSKNGWAMSLPGAHEPTAHGLDPDWPRATTTGPGASQPPPKVRAGASLAELRGQQSHELIDGGILNYQIRKCSYFLMENMIFLLFQTIQCIVYISKWPMYFCAVSLQKGRTL